MRFAAPSKLSQDQPLEGCPRQAAPASAFAGFQPLIANFTQLPNTIWELRLPGLTDDLRWTLATLGRLTVGEAYRRGGSPYDFVPISWARWMKILDLQTLNAVKNRLARLEAMGLIEIRPGERGPGGTTANQYRLRWANDGQAASQNFHAVLRTRGRELQRKQGVREGGYSPANTPPLPGYSPANTPPANSPGVSAQANTPSFKHKEYLGNTNCNPSVSPAAPRANGLTDRVPQGDFDWTPWLRAEDSQSWPEPLLVALDDALDPPQMPGLEERSPWSEEGAWAILQGIRTKGRNLNNRSGTLWNALLQVEKGVCWLAKAGPVLRQAGWCMEPEDGTPAAKLLRTMGGQRLEREGFSRLPLHGAALEKQRSLRTPPPCPEFDPDPYDYDDDPETEEPMTQPNEDHVTRVEEFSPETKAELRARIEAFRIASSAARTAPTTNCPGFFDGCSKAWTGIGDVLEPVLPVVVVLPDEGRPVAIRQRSQIKMNIVNALYQAVS